MSSVAPIYGPNQRPDPDRDIAELFRRVADLERRPPGRWIYADDGTSDPDVTPDSPPFLVGQNAGGGERRLRIRRTNEWGLDVAGVVIDVEPGDIVINVGEIYRPDETEYGTGGTSDGAVHVWALHPNGDLEFLGTLDSSANTCCDDLTASDIDFFGGSLIPADNVQDAIEEVKAEVLELALGGGDVPDPSGEPDGAWLRVSGGALVYVTTDPYVVGGTDVAVTDGGTGASTDSGARSNLGLVIGTDVEAHDTDLTTIAGLSPTNDDVIQRKAGVWTNRSMAQLIADLAALGTTFQGLDATLTALAGLATGADKFPYSTGTDAFSQADLTSFARTLLDDADAAAVRSTLGLGALATLSAIASAQITDDSIVNADINSAAAIAYSKLNLASSIVQTDLVTALITALARGPAWTVLTKASDTSRNSTTTPSADPHLTFTPSSGDCIEFLAIIVFASPSGGGTPDIKATFAEDATVRGDAFWWGIGISDTATSASLVTTTAATGSLGTATTKRMFIVHGTHVSAGAAFNFNWSQNTSSASPNDTTVYGVNGSDPGSILAWRKLR